MSKLLKKLLISVIAVAMCFTFAIAMNGIKNVSATTIETFDMSTASVRLVEPTGIRFTTEVNKTYRDTTLSGKDYSFGTLIIPVDVYEKSGAQELTHSVDDVMVVSQQTWGKDVNGNYAFNAVLKNIPSTEYGRELMARSFVTIDGVTTYSVTTLTKSIGQVASETLAEIPEIETTSQNENKVSVLSSQFLLGRICTKNIYNFNNELLIQENNKLTKKQLKEIIKFGKLRELMLYLK